ncbi:MAG: hypothetical protein GEU77_06115 [Deltaproteobacteria bacterium]|nr:hypothetical protein [Deltaproteobacteria bacterium]
MRLSPVALLYRSPVKQWMMKHTPHYLAFHWMDQSVSLHTLLCRPESRTSLGPLFAVLRPKYDQEQIRAIAVRYLVMKRWRGYLLKTWPFWAPHHEQWVEFHGEKHLKTALEQKKGAILLTGHSFGFGRMVAPTLAQKGYSSYRVGLGWQGADISERWGKEHYRRWHHIHYRWHPGGNIAALKKMKSALAANAVVHVSIQGMPNGESRFAMPFWYKSFYLDRQLLRAIEVLQAPVLPCFALLSHRGRVKVKIHSPLDASINAVMGGFMPLYARYLEEYPELSRIWKRVLQQRKDW